MDENLRLLLYSFYSLGVNDTDIALGVPTPQDIVEANFNAHLAQHNWDGVVVYRS